MKYFVFLLAAAFALGASISPVVSLADDTQAQLQAIYDAQCKTAVAKDFAGFQKLFAPTFTATDSDGHQMNLEQVVAQLQNPPAGLTFDSCAFVIHNVTVAGSTVTATVSETIGGTLTPPGATAQPFTQIQESTDTWAVSSPPQQLTSVETGERVTLAGKVVQEKGTMMTAPATPPAKP